MKKNLSILLPVLLLVGIVVVYFSLQSSKENIQASEAELWDFAIKDTGAIDHIEIIEPNGYSIEITRRNTDEWRINDGVFAAQETSVDLILETLYRIRVKSDVSKKALDGAMKVLAVSKKEVKVYSNGSTVPTKTYYVGGATPDKVGTYMMFVNGNESLEGKLPYITHKPGMYGHLASRFFSSLEEWRKTSVLEYGRGDIKQVYMQHFEEPHLSHTVKINEEGQVQLFDHGNEEIKDFNVASTQRYITQFKRLNYVSLCKELTAHQTDSLLKSNPLYTISVTDKNDEVKKVIIHRKKAPPGLTDYKGDVIYYDEDMWANIDGSNEVMKIQAYSWETLFKPVIFFTTK